MREPLAFISYSHQDADWARAFARSLQDLGLQVWFDEFKVRPGELVGQSVEEALRESEALILVLSEESLQSPWLNFELGLALGTGKRLVAIVPGDLDPAKLPPALRSRRFLIRHSPEETAEAFAAQTAA
ncbi:MAG TPA: toll/interleukin-1 receptor domain-containing protein [Thermoanaerobaculia bacterium]|nr:toll/interleukin-1 receptor domain-containing protein [Thermoanaerobaculia bacterium]